MGLKFTGKTSPSAPGPSEIEERELLINLADEMLYTSSDGSDIINLSSDGTGSIWDPNVTYKIGDIISYNGDVYVSTIVNNVANIPGSGPEWTTYNIPVASNTITGTIKLFVDGTDTLYISTTAANAKP